MYPFKFRPILKTVLWGGEKIIPYKQIESDQKQVGESWELSGVKGNESVVANGELANYKTLSFTFSDYKVESGSGGVRIGVYHTTDGGGCTWKQMGDSFYANGTKTIDLEAFAKESGVDLAKVTSICFGGSNGAGSVTLKPSEMYIAMGTSAIHDAGSETKAAAAGVAYDLHGRLTKPNAKGMVIVGGKKHFNK